MKASQLSPQIETFYHPSGRAFDAQQFASELKLLLNGAGTRRHKLLFLCIGSERIVGDSLGPLVGHRLAQFSNACSKEQAPVVLGTLQQPVHAMNLHAIRRYIRSVYPDHTVIAIDASLGSPQHIGCVTLCNQGLAPGLGVSKQLPTVGDISITGIVGGMEESAYRRSREQELLHARLALVVELADAIYEGLLPILEEIKAFDYLENLS